MKPLQKFRASSIEVPGYASALARILSHKLFRFLRFTNVSLDLFYDELDEEVQESTNIFSDQETLENCEIFNSLDVPATETYDYLWKKLKSY